MRKFLDILKEGSVPDIPIKPRIEIDRFGTIYYLVDTPMGPQFHRLDGPAIESVDGSFKWFRNGELHREDGPAEVFSNGRKIWYRNDRRHREDGPAYEDGDTLKWYIDGKVHRNDGPAVIESNGFREWWINGKHINFGKWLELNNKINDKPFVIKALLTMLRYNENSYELDRSLDFLNQHTIHWPELDVIKKYAE